MALNADASFCSALYAIRKKAAEVEEEEKRCPKPVIVRTQIGTLLNLAANGTNTHGLVVNACTISGLSLLRRRVSKNRTEICRRIHPSMNRVSHVMNVLTEKNLSVLAS